MWIFFILPWQPLSPSHLLPHLNLRMSPHQWALMRGSRDKLVEEKFCATKRISPKNIRWDLMLDTWMLEGFMPFEMERVVEDYLVRLTCFADESHEHVQKEWSENEHINFIAFDLLEMLKKNCFISAYVKAFHLLLGVYLFVCISNYMQLEIRHF